MNRWVRYAAILLPAVLVLYLARGILAPFLFAVVTAYVVSPSVDWVQAKSRLPRAAVIGVFYLVFFGAIAGAILAIEPTVARQSRELFNSGEGVSNAVVDRATENGQVVTILQRLGVDIVPQDDPDYPEKRDELAARFQEQINSWTTTGKGVSLAQTTFGIALNLIIWLSATFYLLLNGKRSLDFILRFVPDRNVPRVLAVWQKIHRMLGGYLRGQLTLIGIMTVSSWIVLIIFRVPYALPIALFTGFVEIVPFVGPILAAVVAAAVALTSHGLGGAVGVIICYTVLRQVEDQIVMPQIVGRVVHLDPVVTIFAVLAGEHIGGFIGVLIAIPVAAAARVIVDEVFPPKPVRDFKAEAAAGMLQPGETLEEMVATAKATPPPLPVAAAVSAEVAAEE